MNSGQNSAMVNHLVKEYLNEISSDENAESYLAAEGLDPAALLSDGLRKIRQFKMRIASAKTESIFALVTAKIVSRAREEAARIMSAPGFSFASYAKKENLVLAYRNLESLTEEEIREFLEKHIALKLQASDDEMKK